MVLEAFADRAFRHSKLIYRQHPRLATFGSRLGFFIVRGNGKLY